MASAGVVFDGKQGQIFKPSNTNKMQKIKLVVACQYGDKENILGYILPELPNNLQVLHASVIRGAVVDRLAGSCLLPEKWRLASAQDFADFRVSFDGFKNDRHEYAD